MKDGSVEIRALYGPDPNRQEGEAWRMRIRWADPSIGQVAEIQLRNAEGLTPSELRRFGWDRWIRVADAFTRHQDPAHQSPPAEADGLERIRWQQQPDPEGAALLAQALRQAIDAQPHRPGSAGHPDQHYERTAQAYLALVASGEPAPTKRLAEQLGRNYDTVAGWIREARHRKLLPAARHGKPG